MYLSWYRHRAPFAGRMAERKTERRTRRIPLGLYYSLRAEELEDRIAPAATLSLPTSGFSGATNTTVMNFPIGISALTDGTHVGLGAANFAITYPAGVFNLPVGGNLATADVNLGAIPL